METIIELHRYQYHCAKLEKQFNDLLSSDSEDITKKELLDLIQDAKILLSILRADK